MTYKQKYRLLQKTYQWQRAKQLVIQYKDDHRCAICKSVARNDFVLHHDKYKVSEIFTPSFLSLVHVSCHEKHHKK
jgi:hypothetical protein